MSRWLEELLGIELQAPHALWLALMVSVAALARALRGPPTVDFVPFGLFSGPARFPKSWRVQLAPLPTALACAGLLVLCVALARPAQRMIAPRVSLGVDIMLVLDVSSSMAEEDLERGQNRLDAAREAALAFVRARPDDRIGLMSFARYADLVVPLTRDHRALAQGLAGLAHVSKDDPEDATALGLATATAAQSTFRAVGADPGRQRVVVLLTDGDENVHYEGAAREIAPLDAAEVARALGVRVHGIAVGTGTRGGKAAPIDTHDLQRFASRTGGRFARARDANALDSVFRDLDSVERAPLAEPDVLLVPRHGALLAAGIGLVLLARLLRMFVFRVVPA